MGVGKNFSFRGTVRYNAGGMDVFGAGQGRTDGRKGPKEIFGGSWPMRSGKGAKTVRWDSGPTYLFSAIMANR